MYGGTCRTRHCVNPAHGLSPRVRGNRWHGFRPYRISRSIPACTGEPCLTDGRHRVAAVYPRVYGGTCQGAGTQPTGTGLSPRVRGNPATMATATDPAGSIPACTGEPSYRRLDKPFLKVYPRVYGGTSITGMAIRPSAGLSPRVRGNPWRWGRCRFLGRSIPACTGEPPGREAPARPVLVYPRVYGGTMLLMSAEGVQGGLSPRVRGNPFRNRNKMVHMDFFLR